MNICCSASLTPDTFLSTVFCWAGARLLSRSGEQLYVADSYSETDQRPLLEIMADPSKPVCLGPADIRLGLPASSATVPTSADVRQWVSGSHSHELTSRIKDHTVPYPSASIDTADHFVDWEDQGLEVEADEAGIIQSWRRGDDGTASGSGKRKPRKKPWHFSVGNLPPVLRYRFPFNYVSQHIGVLI